MIKIILGLLVVSMVGCSSIPKKVEYKYPQYISTKINYADLTISQCQGFYSKDFPQENQKQILEAEQVSENSFIYREENSDIAFFGVSNNTELESAIQKCDELVKLMDNE